MEGEIIMSSGNGKGFMKQMMSPVLVPLLLISIGYIDPGKWVAVIEGGARFGYELLAFMLLFSFIAILCHYVSARITVSTGRNLAQICNEEYDKWTCMFLGLQAELSAILLDLTTVIGVAHALNLLFGIDLLTALLLAAMDAFLFPFFAFFLDIRMANTISIGLASLALLVLYVSGVVLSQREIPLSMNGIFIKLSGESVFILMSLLGAALAPHNLYLHSYFAKENESRLDVAKKSRLCQDHLFAIFCAFSGLSLVNYVLMNASANVFHSTGLVLITFHDAMSLIDQVFKSPLVPMAFLAVMFISNQITALSWTHGGEIIVKDFLKIEIPRWIHRAIIRILGVIPALYCVWICGDEGIYQLLISTQLMVAMMLPSSLIPLFRVSLSRQIMGLHKIPQIIEFFVLSTFLGIFGLNVMFLAEMCFGSSDWVSGLRWIAGMSTSLLYFALLVFASVSLCLTLWLAVTPLKSAGNCGEGQIGNSDIGDSLPLASALEERSETQPCEEDSLGVVEEREQMETSVASSGYGGLPDTTVMSEQEIHSGPREEDKASPMEEEEEEESVLESLVVSESMVVNDAAVESKEVKMEPMTPMETTVSEEINNTKGEKKEEDEVQVETEEAAKPASSSSYFPLVQPEGPPSFRSLSGINEEGGSLSRLGGGLGRAARRHFAALLDEFWGQLYDLHGSVVAEARANQLDLIHGVANPVKSDSYGSESRIHSNSYDSLQQPRQPGSIDSLYRGNVNSSNYEAGERRYSSLRAPPSSTGQDYQPATVHSYQLTSYLNKLAKERLELLHARGEIPASRSQSVSTKSYSEQLALALRQKSSHNGVTPGPAPGFQNHPVSRSIQPLQSGGRSYYDVPSSGHVEKKYNSMPDISGLSMASRDNKSGYGHGSGYGYGWDGSYGRVSHDSSSSSSLYSNSALRVGLSLPFDDISTSRGYRDTFALPQTTSANPPGSLWSRPPFEQFGLGSEEQGSRSSADAVVNKSGGEAKLLQSFRECVVKLLKLDGSEWLFGQGDGADEELIDCVAARERFIYGEISQATEPPKVSSVPNCGDGCVWRTDLVLSFGVWCIHRVLHLSLMESRPELWGKYTYVLNRLQGVIDPAFSKPRIPMTPCFCLQMSSGCPPSRGKTTTATTLLELIKDVEVAISGRKGRSGTAAGDVAFPKGKGNLASVLKRYKRRLGNIPVGLSQDGSGSRKNFTATAAAMYGS